MEFWNLLLKPSTLYIRMKVYYKSNNSCKDGKVSIHSKLAPFLKWNTFLWITLQWITAAFSSPALLPMHTLLSPTVIHHHVITGCFSFPFPFKPVKRSHLILQFTTESPWQRHATYTPTALYWNTQSNRHPHAHQATQTYKLEFSTGLEIQAQPDRPEWGEAEHIRPSLTSFLLPILHFDLVTSFSDFVFVVVNSLLIVYPLASVPFLYIIIQLSKLVCAQHPKKLFALKLYICS